MGNMATEYGDTYEDMDLETMKREHARLSDEAAELKARHDAMRQEANYVRMRVGYRVAEEEYGILHGDVLKRTRTNEHGEKRNSYVRVDYVNPSISRKGKVYLYVGYRPWRKDGKRPTGNARFRHHQSEVRLRDGLATHPRDAFVKDEEASAAAHAWEAAQEAERERRTAHES